MHNTVDIGSPYTELEQAVHAALETYSNVHRGSGHFSMVSTHLFEQARSVVLEYLKLDSSKYVVIFCTPRGAEILTAKIKSGLYNCLSSHDFGLPLGVRAIAVKKNALPEGAPLLTGGGTARLVSPGWVIWDNAPDKFEAGTPAIINIITFASALCLIRKSGNEIFLNPLSEKMTAGEILYNDDLMQFSGKELLDELRKNMIGSGSTVPTADGSKRYINLDNSASTLTSKQVWDAVRYTWHQSGLIQDEIISEVKSICAGFVGASQSDYDLIFTSNTTEAINMAAESISREPDSDAEPVILNTFLEHTSNDLPWRMISKFSLTRLQVDAEGFLNLKEMEEILSEYNQRCLHGKKRIRLMAITGASNVLGSFNNIEEISNIVHKYGARLLVDAAQLVAHRKIEMGCCAIDYLAFSAHKVYAPFGTGVLVVKKGLLRFTPAEMKQIKASGEENAGGIAALGKSLILMQRIGLDVIKEKEMDLTRQILRGLSQIDGLTIYGINDPDSPRFAQKGGVIVFSMKGIMANRIAAELAERGGIGVRYGCHCAHILIKHLLGVGPGLERFQRFIVKVFPRLRLPGVARVSLGMWNTEEDIDAFIDVMNRIAAKTKHVIKVKQQIKEFIEAASRRVYSKI